MGAENRRMMTPRVDWIHGKAQNTTKSNAKTPATPHAHQNIPSTTYFKKFAHLHQSSTNASKMANSSISNATTKPKQQQQRNRRLMIASKGHALFNTMRMLQRNNPTGRPSLVPYGSQNHHLHANISASTKDRKRTYSDESVAPSNHHHHRPPLQTSNAHNRIYNPTQQNSPSHAIQRSTGLKDILKNTHNMVSFSTANEQRRDTNNNSVESSLPVAKTKPKAKRRLVEKFTRSVRAHKPVTYFQPSRILAQNQKVESAKKAAKKVINKETAQNESGMKKKLRQQKPVQSKQAAATGEPTAKRPKKIQEAETVVPLPGYKIIEIQPLRYSRQKDTLEATSDASYEKRHLKGEKQEKLIVRRDRQRQREEELRERVTQSPRYTIYTQTPGKKSQQDQTKQPENLERIRFLSKLETIELCAHVPKKARIVGKHIDKVVNDFVK